jgi:hypothetical protein
MHPITHKSNFKLKHVSRATSKFNAEAQRRKGAESNRNEMVFLAVFFSFLYPP